MTADQRASFAMAATCSRGLEEALDNELSRLGATDVSARRGAVVFTGDLACLYRCNVALRTAQKVLVTLTQGQVRDKKELYELSSRPPWEELIREGQTFAVEAVGSSQHFASPLYAAQVVKDAVVDRIRRRTGQRPDVERRDPDLRLHLHLAAPRVSLSLDSSGEPLAHRGYRPHSGPAPLAETLAAGILLLAGYDGSQPLLDPMCGSGTIVVEAALIATGSAPGLRRRFACERWRWHEAQLLERVRSLARAAQRTAPAPIVAADADRRAVTATLANLRRAGVASAVTVRAAALRQLEELDPGTLVVSNPPYGHRMGKVEELTQLYREIGDTLKRSAVGSNAWLLAGEPELAKHIGLKPSRRIILYNGPIKCRLLRFELYAGSKLLKRRGFCSAGEEQQHEGGRTWQETVARTSSRNEEKSSRRRKKRKKSCSGD